MSSQKYETKQVKLTQSGIKQQRQPAGTPVVMKGYPKPIVATSNNRKTGVSKSKTVGIKLVKGGVQAVTPGTRVNSARYDKPLRSVPVAFENGGMKPFSYVTTHPKGDSYTAHVLDRLDPITLGSATHNVTGGLLYSVPINPELLGERLRRIASCFEYYKFGFIRIHFISALGTQFGGSILGMFDSDPVDSFNEGVVSLKSAAAHPSAAAHKIWNDSTWTAPKPPPGRFYVDVNSSDAASQRQQNQGSFNLLLDSAITLAGGTIVYPLTLGNIYIEYVCTLSYPTIQTNFFGSYLQSIGKLAAPIADSAIGAVAVQSPFRLQGVRDVLVASATGTIGLVFVPLPTSPEIGYAIRLQPGVWNVTFGWLANYNDASILRQCYNQFVSGSSLALVPNPTMINYTDSAAMVPVQNGSNGVVVTGRAGNFFNASTDTSTTFRGHSTRVVVPAGDTYLWAPVWRCGTATSALTISSLFLELTVAVPTTSESAMLAPAQVTLSSRLAAVEALLANRDVDPPSDDDEKDFIPPSVTPPPPAVGRKGK